MAQKQANFTLIGGRVQMTRGPYAPTSDAVWLASVAWPRVKSVLDVGVGTGAVSLCLMTHNPNAVVTGIDISEEMLATCAKNAELNGREIKLICADITTFRTAETFDLVLTNPPYFRGTPAKHNAHHNADIKTWTRKCAARVKPRGHIGLIVDVAVMADVIEVINHAFGDITIYPLVGAGGATERVIIRARCGVRGGARIMPPISMNTDAVLRDGLTIDDALSKLGV